MSVLNQALLYLLMLGSTMQAKTQLFYKLHLLSCTVRVTMLTAAPEHD